MANDMLAQSGDDFWTPRRFLPVLAASHDCHLTINADKFVVTLALTLPSPPRRGDSQRTFPFFRMTVRPIQSRILQKRGERESPLLGERVG